MYKAVKTVVNSNTASWTGLPAFVSVFNTFTEKLVQLETLGYNQAFIALGVGKVKSKKRKEASELVIPISNALKAYAQSVGNESLKQKMNFPPSNLLYKSDFRVNQLISFVIEKAELHLAELGDFGVSQQMLDELNNVHDELRIIFNAPRKAIIDRKLITTQIKGLVGDLDTMLRRQLDLLAGVLKPSELEFFTSYKNARVIIDLRTGGTTEGIIPFDETEEPEDSD